MSERRSGKVVITLSSRGGEALRKELVALGPAGEKALKRIDRASKPVGPGLKAVDSAAREAGRGFDDMANRAGPAGRILTSIGPAGQAAAIGIGAIALASAAALRVAREATRSFDAMAKSADDLALHTDTFQALRFQAQKANIDFNNIEASMRQFVRASADASTGRGELTEKLKLSHPELLKEILLQDTIENKLNAVAKALGNAKDEQERTLISTAAFGESGRAMIRVLGDQENAIESMITEAREMGFVIEESVLRNAEEMETKIGLASTAIDLQLKQSLIDLAPLLVNTAEGLAKLAKGAALFYGGFKDILDGPGQFEFHLDVSIAESKLHDLDIKGDQLLSKIRNIDRGATDAGRADGTLGAGKFINQKGDVKVSARLQLFDNDVRKAKDVYDKAVAELDQYYAANAPTGNPLAPSGGGDEGGIGAEERAKLLALVAAATGRSTTAAEKLTATLQALDQAREAGIITSDKQLEKLKASERAFAGKASAQKRAAEAARALAEQDRFVASVVAATITPQEKYTAELEKLDAARKRLSDGQYAAAEAKLAAQRDKDIAALKEKNRLQARAAELIETLGNITASILTPQEKYNQAIRDLNAQKPWLTAEQYAAALKKEKQALKESNDEAQRKLDLQNQLKQIRQSIKTDEERLDDELARLEKLRQSTSNPDGLSDDEYAKAVKNATDQYKNLNREATTHVDLLDQMIRGIAGQEGAWEQFLSIAIRGLIQLAAQAILTKDQVSGSGSGGGGLLDILGSILGGSSGSGSGSSSGGDFSGGGFGDFLGAILGGSSDVGFTPPISGASAASAPVVKPVSGAAAVGAVKISTGFTSSAAPANDKSSAPTQLVIKNYGKPATAEVNEGVDAQGLRQMEIRMFEIGKRGGVAAIADGSADVAIGQRFNITPKPGAIG